MKTRRLITVFFGVAFSFSVFVVPGALAGVCGPDRVWVPPHTTPDGARINGFCRHAVKKGFRWVPGHSTSRKGWVPGHWKPVGPAPPGKRWVPGHLNPGGTWVPGHWRMRRHSGKTWVPGHYNRKGRWVPGRFR